MAFLVDIVDPNNNNAVIGQVWADWWVNPYTGDIYKVPVGYDPINTINAVTDIYKILPITGSPSQGLPWNIASVIAIDLGVNISNLYDSYQAGGMHDLQRTAPDGTSYGGFVPDFRNIASFDFGLAASTVGLAPTEILAAGGLYNWKQSLTNPNVKTEGMWWNNTPNDENILRACPQLEDSQLV